MIFLAPSFKGGKRENAFLIKRGYPLVDRFGMQPSNGKGYYIYEYDFEQRKHIQKWIDNDGVIIVENEK